ncbi:MAG TPA: branched-chain amino acid ABC transporter permease [Streptosporangiaceae bacterium]|jgi:branched-chain amino acid transport system permease protein
MSTANASRGANPLRRIGAAYDRMRDRWAVAPAWLRWIVYILCIGIVLLPSSEAVSDFLAPESGMVVWFFPVGIYILLALGLNVVIGHAGLLDLGYVAFFAIGAYAMAILGVKFGWDFWAILPAGILIAAVSGILLGAPTLRLRGDYLAIVTLGFGEIIRIIAVNTGYLGKSNGIPNIPTPPSIAGVQIGDLDVFGYKLLALDPRPFYYLLVALCVVTIIFVRRLQKSRVGRAWTALREDEDAAEVMGVPTFRFKLLSFAIGASIGGAAGVMYATATQFVVPDNFQFMLSATILAGVVLGGAGNIPGVIIGAFLVGWLPERFRALQDYRVMIFGAALVLMMALRPEGLLPSRTRKSELAEGTGGMGSLGAEVAGPTQTAPEVGE